MKYHSYWAENIGYRDRISVQLVVDIKLGTIHLFTFGIPNDIYNKSGAGSNPGRTAPTRNICTVPDQAMSAVFENIAAPGSLSKFKENHKQEHKRCSSKPKD